MNSVVRAYLIEIARQKDKFVYYSDMVKDCALRFDLSTAEGQLQLSQTLSDISRFENTHSRPMLTSIAIGKQDNDHGNGFYDLAEEFGFGKNKTLHSQFWGMQEAGRTREYWQNENNFKQFAYLHEPQQISSDPPFFTTEEMEFFKQWQYKPYNKENNEHVAAKDYLMNTIWEKNIYLCNRIVSLFDDFSIDGKKIWHQRGWRESDGIKSQGTIFKFYTWVKVFRNIDKGKDVFFTFGIDAHPDVEAFVYKIDCQREGEKSLSQQQIDLCDSLIPISAKFNEISFDALIDEDWASLTRICVDFIKKHLEQYDAIIRSVWGAPIPTSLFKNTLIWRQKPKDGFDKAPNLDPNFKGVDIDFQKKAKEQKDLGDKGEQLVKQNEINYLEKKGLNHLAQQVIIAKDGEGYDVLSFDEFGNKKYIEVKTTTGTEYAPFYLSDHEISFMRLHSNQYSIYRIFNYDEESNFGEYFEIKENVESQLILYPCQFKVFLKKDMT
jgi:hypothetical protein